jgi:hypothetical protein
MAQVDSLDALEVVTPCPMLWSEMQATSGFASAIGAGRRL